MQDSVPFNRFTTSFSSGYFCCILNNFLQLQKWYKGNLYYEQIPCTQILMKKPSGNRSTQSRAKTEPTLAYSDRSTLSRQLQSVSNSVIQSVRQSVIQSVSQSVIFWKLHKFYTSVISDQLHYLSNIQYLLLSL